MIDRRAMLGGLAVSALAASADAAKAPPPAPETPLFATGPLTRNLIASRFTVPRKPLTWHKYTRLLDPQGKKTSMEAYRGKLVLVSLWAEWCTPCLLELPGIAYHRKRATTDKFELVPICTGTEMFDRPSQIGPAMEKFNGLELNSLLDVSNDEYRLIDTVCKDPNNPKVPGAIPCMLIVDPAGLIRGHTVGGPGVKVDTGKDAGNVYNAWLTNVGQEFVSILAKGDVELAPPA